MEVFVEDGKCVVHGSDFSFVLFGELNFKFGLEVVQHFSLFQFGEAQVFQIPALFQVRGRYEEMTFENEVEFLADRRVHGLVGWGACCMD